MATRSRIGMKLSDGTVKSVYCHWDGYPENNGKLLLRHYNDENKISALLELGNLSSLCEEIGEKHDLNSDHTSSKWCIFYGRDRGEWGNEAVIHPSTLDFTDQDGWIEFLYLFDNGSWYYSPHGSSVFSPLTQKVCGLEETS